MRSFADISAINCKNKARYSSIIVCITFAQHYKWHVSRCLTGLIISENWQNLFSGANILGYDCIRHILILEQIAIEQPYFLWKNAVPYKQKKGWWPKHCCSCFHSITTVFFFSVMYLFLIREGNKKCNVVVILFLFSFNHHSFLSLMRLFFIREGNKKWNIIYTNTLTNLRNFSVPVCFVLIFIMASENTSSSLNLNRYLFTGLEIVTDMVTFAT